LKVETLGKIHLEGVEHEEHAAGVDCRMPDEAVTFEEFSDIPSGSGWIASLFF